MKNTFCPITYEHLNEGEISSQKGLHKLSPKLHTLNQIPYSSAEQRFEAAQRSGKLSIQGVQPKLSVILDLSLQTFSFVDHHGHYILKPENNLWPELPANEAITMTLASLFKIDVPVHGLVFTKNNELTYFIKRFDRKGKKKIAIEDFTQLSELTSDTKYNSSIENVIKIIDQFSTFPKIDYVSLFKRVLFNFVIGNEDMHLKNYSLINTQDDIYELAPAYDFLSTTIALTNPMEESALPLNGKKNKLKYADFVEYLAKTRLSLPVKIIDNTLQELESLKNVFIDYIGRSYLSPTMQDAYVDLLTVRYARLFDV